MCAMVMIYNILRVFVIVWGFFGVIQVRTVANTTRCSFSCNNDSLPHIDASITASSKIPTPSYTTGQNYELFKKEINIWEKITSIEKDKQGLHVLLNLPGKDRDPHGIKDKLLEVCDIDDLGKDDGLKSLLATMDKYLGKDDLEDAWDRFQRFEDCKKSPSESWFDYITNFDNNYERIKSKGITLPASILAFKLLKGADLNDEERLIIMTGLDFTKKDELYNQAKKSLKNLNVEWELQVLQLMISVV